ncbi:putative G-protein coupled receptor 153 [Anabarilius grahami]|uniref:Putative G-protein coupled receptor 153 n=1 Tax=Anabarilius grahami TaxID=495550 RepID=A0A3N0ZB24_ANAGA|nr:putative G-protein coupled receptor 153 [Anabarilius grahami]
MEKPVKSLSRWYDAIFKDTDQVDQLRWDTLTTYDVLPSRVNLSQWYGEDPTCPLCSPEAHLGWLQVKKFVGEGAKEVKVKTPDTGQLFGAQDLMLLTDLNQRLCLSAFLMAPMKLHTSLPLSLSYLFPTHLRKVVSFASLKFDRSYSWMVLCVLWCSIAQSILLPMFLWACDRYRADVKMVWEKCVAIMSNDEVDEENSQDGGIHPDLIFDRPFDYSSAGDIMTVDRIAKYEFSTLERGGPQGYPLRELQEDKMHYLQVPPTRRYSHDETDMWTTGQIPSYLHRWGSTEDIIGIPQCSLPRHERRRSSPAPYHEESHPHRKRRRSEDMHSLKQIPRVERYEDDFKCFSRDEVIKFIDETPLASPMRSPRRASAISLVPETFQQHIVLLPHFPLTHFEREPQALRRCSDHGKGAALPEIPQDTPRKTKDGSDGRSATGEGSGIKGSVEHRRDPKRASELVLLGQGGRTGDQSSSSIRTRQVDASAWVEQKHLSKGESKGSTNSFISSQSASSGYITFHSESIGSTN